MLFRVYIESAAFVDFIKLFLACCVQALFALSSHISREAMASTVVEDVTFNVAPSRLWAAMKDSHNLLPKLLPDHFHSIELLEGSGAPGSTRIVNFGPAALEVVGSLYVKERLEFIDEASRTVSIAAIEGGQLGKGFSSMKGTTTFGPGKDASSTVATMKLEYDAIGEPPLDKLKEGSIQTLKAVEAYLQSNADAYA